MTRNTNARLAGFMFLFYIATALTEMVVFDRASSGQSAAARLASIAQNAPLVRAAALLTFLTFVDAVALGVALYGLTRDVDHELAMLALCCRVTEGVNNAVGATQTLQLLSVATASVTAAGPDAAATTALGALLLRGSGTMVSATSFAIGSTIFAYLFLRARTIPLWLAWTGVLGSALLALGLPMQTAGLLRGPVTYLIWIPVAVFEVVLGFWLLIKGVAAPTKYQGKPT
jgi:hypothetical protein